MPTIDRRRGGDRRDNERYKIHIEIEWENSSGRNPGTISDISESGFFVLSSGEVEDGESVKIFFPLADGRKFPFEGKVVNHIFEIGFAMQFIELSDAQKNFLQKLINRLRNK